MASKLSIISEKLEGLTKVTNMGEMKEGLKDLSEYIRKARNIERWLRYKYALYNSYVCKVFL